MAFPSDVILREVTFGPAFDLTSGEGLAMRVTFTPTRSMVRGAPTGAPGIARAYQVLAEEGMQGALSIPVTDQTGWFDGNGNALSVADGAQTHAYRVLIESLKDGRPIGGAIPAKTIVLPQGDLSPVDLDGLIPVTSAAGVSVAIPDEWFSLVASAEEAAAAAQAAIVDSDAFVAAKVADPDSLTGAALSNTYGADAMSNPESPLNGATVEVVESVFGAGVAGVPFFFNGALDDTNAARPAWNGVVVWRVFEGDPAPANIGPNDEIDEVEVEPLPDVLVWADDFNRANGALTTTATGGLPYVVFGGAGDAVFGVVGNQAALTAGTGSAGYCLVDSGAARGVLEITVPTQDSGYGGVAFRFQDVQNNFVLSRVSASDFTYRLVKRIGNTVTVVKVFTGVTMASGDVIRIDDRVLGALKVYVNGVLQFDQSLDTTVSVNEISSASFAGLYLGSTNIATTADNVRFDNASYLRVA